MKETLQKQRDYFSSQETKEVDFRLRQLSTLKRMLEENEKDILASLQEDLGKSEIEAYETEIGLCHAEINYARKKLSGWAKKKRVRTPITGFPAKSYQLAEPYGVVLIISPWNYPWLLTINPLIGAIAAGNCVVIKPSAYSRANSVLLADLISKYFKEDYISVVLGGREENIALLEQDFDYIFFTGSTAVGREVMEKAAKYLTPVTLELGGKSPVIIDDSAKLELAAKRIAWGKLVNGGQTCIAPDYVLVQESLREDLLRYVKKEIEGFYGPDPLFNEEYPKIINEKHFDRLLGLLEGQHIVAGGASDRASLKIEPTLLVDVDPDSGVMQEEIFGPILPILTFKRLEEAIHFVESRPKPLALYHFSEDKTLQDQVQRQLSFGGGCINDTLMQVSTHYLPFGGVGASGMGSYHGKKSFDTFSHYKSILNKSTWLDVPLRYPPYEHGDKKEKKLSLIKKLMK